MFYLTFLGQTVVAISQIFVLGVPALLAATWFPAHQVLVLGVPIYQVLVLGAEMGKSRPSIKTP
jgi:hypothetical protein